MAPRHRQPQPAQLRSHSRSSSATRLGSNLQALTDKTRKNDFHNKPHPSFARVNSSQRVRSKENLQHVLPKRPSLSKLNGKFKSGFTLSNQGDQDDDDDDEWVSTESGAASPDHSDCESNAGHLPTQRLPDEHPSPQLDRPETPRPLQAPDLSHVQASGCTTAQSTGDPPPPSQIYYFNPEQQPQLQRALSSETMKESPPHSNVSSSLSKQRPPGTRRRSRPSSMHSTTSRNDPVLRPRPLCYVSKQGPLAPLAVIPDSTSTDSTSARQPYHDGDEAARSPSSVASDAALKRRSSVSSARSVSTVPIFHSKDMPRGPYERTRTLSAIPFSSSSAALSSLTHLPSVTRPPSPQAIVFFPPHNPHANIDGIHPLLPSPYMSNHMTVLMRRTPLKESYDRVMRAKLAASR
ncbi:hypothetical protein F5887DRAFT_633773 [Amanita rubescens]|nr:hypothetical protein F5887DRAFT_633773 [Amanita rubescens]